MTIKKRLYANNAKTTLALDITPYDTTIQVTDGSQFPTPALGEYFLATLEFGASIEIVKVTGRSGNSFTGCIRGQEDKPALSFQAGIKVGNRVTRDTLRDFEKGIGLMDRVESIDALDSPLNSGSNAYICNSLDSSGNSSVAIKNSDTSWRFLTHSTVAVTGSVNTSTSTSISSTSIGNKLISIVPGKYIIQFMTGNNRGLARAITAVNTNGLGWFTALPESPSNGDQFEVYMSDSSTLGDGTGIVPITSGGTGSITAPGALVTLGALPTAGGTMTGALNFAAPVSVTVANVPTIPQIASNNITITGTGNINSMGIMAAGAVRLLTFTGVATLVHSVSALVLPTAANITTATGDSAMFLSQGNGVWKCTSFQRSNGQSLVGNNSIEYVQQGGGTGQAGNKVYLGSGNTGGVKVTVDSTDQGYLVFSSKKDEINTWQNLFTTGSLNAAYFAGNGGGLTNVNAVDTQSISGATNKPFGWTGIQSFYSPSQGAVVTSGYPNTSLRVSDMGAASSSAAMTFVREGSFGINLGLGVSNNFIIGGYSAGLLLTLTPTGDLIVPGSISGLKFYGDGSGLTGLVSPQITGALGFTPVQQGTGVGQLTNTIRIGYSVSGQNSGIKMTVDNTDFGYAVMSTTPGPITTDKPFTTSSSISATYFSGNGGGLTNVSAVNTTSITNALNKLNKWSAVQLFPSYAATGVWENSTASTSSLLQVAGTSSGAAIMTFVREGLYAVNVGLDNDNSWGVGGYTAGAGKLMSINPAGDFIAKNTVTTKSFYGDISNTTGLTSGQVSTALGFTPLNLAPSLAPGGVLKVGKYLDFRLSSQTVDNDARIECGSTGSLRAWANWQTMGNQDIYGTLAVAGTLTGQSSASITGTITSGTGFYGNGANVSNVTAVNTTYITSATNKPYVWSGRQEFQSHSTVLGEGQGEVGSLLLSDGPAKKSAGLSFLRTGITGINMGLDVDDIFRIGGWSWPIVLSLTPGGNLAVKGISTGEAGISTGFDKTIGITGSSRFQANTLGLPDYGIQWSTIPGQSKASVHISGAGGFNVYTGGTSRYSISEAGTHTFGGPASFTQTVYSAGGFSGNGAGLSNVVASNALSITSAVGNTYTWAKPQTFTSAGVGNDLKSGIPGLSVFSYDGNATALSLVRNGVYGLNLGLDTNNAFIIGGYSSSIIRLVLDATGAMSIASGMHATGFFGDGSSVTNVTAVNTNNISNALDRSYTWTKPQIFISTGQNAPLSNGTSGLVVSSLDNGSTSINFDRRGIYSLNMGLDTGNSFVIGGASSPITRLVLDTSGNMSVAGGVYGTAFTGNGSALTGFTSPQITSALGFTPVRQGTGPWQLSNTIHIGYSTSSGTGAIKLAVDSTDFGFIPMSSTAYAYTTDKPINTISSISASSFSGGGAGLTGVVASNTNSVAGALNKSYTWGLQQTFTTIGVNSDFTSGTPGAVIGTSDSNSATLGLVSNGFGLHVGLDANRVFKIGGWSTFTRLSLDVNGSLTTAGHMYAPGFHGDGSTLTGVIASDTNSISRAVDKSYRWSGIQNFPCTGLSAVETPSVTPSSTLKVVAAQTGAAAAMSFLREGSYGINMGLNTNNDFVVGGWSNSGARFWSNTSGDFTVAGKFNNGGSITAGGGFYGNGANISLVTAVNTTSIAGSLANGHAWTNLNSFSSYAPIAISDRSGNLAVTALTNTASASMTFIRSGIFAVNMGLDADNVFKIGGYSAGTTPLFSLDMSGNLTTLGNITAYSDKRIKKDIEPIKNALGNLLKLTGVTFSKISNDEKGRGFIAQDVEEVYPELVHTAPSGENLKSVAYANLMGDVVEAIRELSDRLSIIEKKLENR